MIDYTQGRLEIVHNPYQGQFRKTLVVCKAGLLRSPTVAWFLGLPPWNRNTRACGSHQEYALVPIDRVLIEWADEVVFMNEENALETLRSLPVEKDMYVLDIPDHFSYRDPKLLKILPDIFKQVEFPESS